MVVYRQIKFAKDRPLGFQQNGLITIPLNSPATEQRIGRFAGIFAFLALSISCIGIFGMASFVAEQRRKEIGLLSREFITLVLISIVLASPLAYHFMQNWLLRYDYHTTIPWWIFVAAGLGVIVITLLTVSYQTIKAALSNPVKSLHTE